MIKAKQNWQKTDIVKKLLIDAQWIIETVHPRLVQTTVFLQEMEKRGYNLTKFRELCAKLCEDYKLVIQIYNGYLESITMAQKNSFDYGPEYNTINGTLYDISEFLEEYINKNNEDFVLEFKKFKTYCLNIIDTPNLVATIKRYFPNVLKTNETFINQEFKAYKILLKSLGDVEKYSLDIAQIKQKNTLEEIVIHIGGDSSSESDSEKVQLEIEKEIIQDVLGNNNVTPKPMWQVEGNGFDMVYSDSDSDSEDWLYT